MAAYLYQHALETLMNGAGSKPNDSEPVVSSASHVQRTSSKVPRW